MNKSLEELKQIVEGAPEHKNYTIKFEEEAPYYIDYLEEVHNLLDLRRIIKLEEENQRLRDLLVKVMDDYQLAASAAEREGYKTSYSELSKIVGSEFEENREGKEL